MFRDKREVQDCLGKQQYIASDEIATVLFLAERFPQSPLGFTDLTARGEAYSWLSYISTGFAEEFWTVYCETLVLDEGDRSPRLHGVHPLAVDDRARLRKVWQIH